MAISMKAKNRRIVMSGILLLLTIIGMLIFAGIMAILWMIRDKNNPGE